MVNGLFWLEFGIIVGIAIISSLARFPLLMTTITVAMPAPNEWEEEFDEFAARFTAAATLDITPGLLDEGILLLIATALGLLLAHSIHLGAPLLETLLSRKPVMAQLQNTLLPGLWFGMGIGLALNLLERLLFRTRLRKIVRYRPTRWRRWKFLLASLHTGIVLEIFLRLFFFCLLAWLMSRIWHTSTGLPPPAILWVSTILVSICAAFIYRQSVLITSAMTGTFSPLIITRTVLLDGLMGIVFGYLFWRYGLEAAITAHLVATISLQLFGERPPLAQPLSEEFAQQLLEGHLKRSGMQIFRLGGVSRFEIVSSWPSSLQRGARRK